MTDEKRADTRNTESSMHDVAVAMQEALTDLVRVYQFRDRQRICYYDVSVTQCYAISMLVAGGPMTLNQLAAELYLNKSTASRVVDALAEKEYVRKSVDPIDGRALNLEVTTGGRELSMRIERELVQQMERILADFEPETARQGARLLARLAEAARTRFTCGSNACLNNSAQESQDPC